MGKSKKRSRTKALYEAAANAANAAANKAKQQRRLLEDDKKEIDNDDKKETTTSTEKGTSTTTGTGTTTAPTVSDIAITIKTIKYLTINNNGNGNGNGNDGDDGDGDETNTSTNNNYDLFHNSKQYKELRKVLHPLIIDRINKVYKNGIDYRVKVTNHLSHQRWLPALGALQGVKDYNQIPKQGTIQRWVRDVDSVDNNSNFSKIKMKLLSSILNCTNVTTNHATTTTTSASKDDDDATATTATANMNKHDPLHALMALQKNSCSNNNSNIDDEYDEYDDDDDEYDNNDNSMKGKKEKGAIDDDEDELKILKGWRIPSSSSFPSSSLDDNSLLLSKLKSITSTTTTGTTTGTGTELNSSNSNTQNTQTQIVYREKGSERTPPNNYDLILHATTSTTCEATTEEDDDEETETEDSRVITKHTIPFLNNNGHNSSGAFVLENVLSLEECNEFIDMSSGSSISTVGSGSTNSSHTKLGYQKDHPLTLKQPTGIDSFEYYISKTIHNIIYKRVYKYLPKQSNQILINTATADGGEEKEEVEVNNNDNNNNNILYGINRRWRFFRYGQDCVYRPHIDGSWPDSTLTKIKVKKGNNTPASTDTTDTYAGNENENTSSSLYEYKYEVDKTGNTRSYLTFLIYLNDNFEGGETKFYYPVTTTTSTSTSTNKDDNNDTSTSAKPASETKTKTSLVARGVIPKRGSVLIFPQGNTASLLHEGSAVTKGIKYVIRTDVLYQHQQQSY